MISYHEESAFLLGDIFDIHKPKKKFNANEVKFGGLYPYVARGSSNNGIRGYITEDTRYLNPANTLSFGQDTATVYYQDKAYFTGDKIKILELRNHTLDETLALYLIPIIRKAFTGFVWGQNSFNESILNKMQIVLPTTPNGHPDWEYMRECAFKLKEEHMHKLDAYLKETGLDDCKLTEKDEQLISPEKTTEWAKFRIGDLFEKLPVKKAKTNDIRSYRNNEFCLPVVYAKYGDNGIMYWGRKDEFTTYSNVISIVYNGVISAGKVYAQEEETGILAESYFIRLKDYQVPFRVNQFLSIVIEKVIYSKYSRENLATWKNRVENEMISLPITSANVPDWDYMEQYIRAIEKTVVADVIKWKDKQINLTKEVVNREVS